MVVRDGGIRRQARWGLGRRYVYPRHLVSNFVLFTRNVTDEEVEGLQERSPANYDGALGGLDQLQISSSKVITEGVNSMINCIGFALEGIPVGRRYTRSAWRRRQLFGGLRRRSRW